MKKILCILFTIVLIIASISTAEAKNNKGENNGHQKKNNTYEEVEQEFYIHNSSFIQYGRYKLPLEPITNGMGATYTYDKASATITITKGTIKLIIDFKHESVTVNGVIDKESGIFKAKNNKKMTVLLKYVAKILGMGIEIDDDDDITVTNPGLDLPSNVTVTPVGTVVVANTLNSTSIYLTASAKIKAGQATGARAELYVGTKLIAIDNTIAAADTSVTFTTSDGTPTNAELQSAVPTGGVVTVKLFNSNNNYTVSTVSNPTLVVDYIVPTITGVTSAIYDASTGQLLINANGAGAVGDIVDVTKLTITDASLGRTYQLTNNATTGSKGSVISTNSLVINVGSADKIGLSGYGASTAYLMIAAGSFLKDNAGNSSSSFSTNQFITVTFTSISQLLDAPRNIEITPVGTAVVANTLNSTTTYMDVIARITAGQATGGKAELYVGSKLVAVDSSISSSDYYVSFTTSDGSPTNAELQALVPSGGVVTVKLYNSSFSYSISSVSNPTLVVNYVASAITGVSSVIYDASAGQIWINLIGTVAVGDIVDVTKLTLIDSTLGRSYQLTNNATTGSQGYIVSVNSLLINVGSVDKVGLSGYGTTTVFLTIPAGTLLKNYAGNGTYGFATNQMVLVTITNMSQLLDAPRNIVITPAGTSIVANTLNSTTISIDVTANITYGQATAGRAELYVGTKLIAVDNVINASDTSVSFTTSDGSPTNAELKALIPIGGVVTVKLYNTTGKSVTSTVLNPTLTVDYISPTLTSISSAIFDMKNNQIYLIVTGAGEVGDIVDVTKIKLYDVTLGRTYQLTAASGTGSTGTVNNSGVLIINLGSIDKINLAGFGSSSVLMTVDSGPLIRDSKGNTSPANSASSGISVTVIK